MYVRRFVSTMFYHGVGDLLQVLGYMMTYRCTIFLHGVGHLVALVAAAFAGEKALLAHVKVEALEAAVSAQHTNANMGSGQKYISYNFH